MICVNAGEIFLTTATPTGGTDGKHPFAQGKLSTFEIEWPDLGEIVKLRLGTSVSTRLRAGCFLITMLLPAVYNLTATIDFHAAYLTGHDGSGHAWQCERITVRNMARAATGDDNNESSCTWEFPCGEWFGTMPGHKLQRDLKVADAERDGIGKAMRTRAERLSLTDSESAYSMGES